MFPRQPKSNTPTQTSSKSSKLASQPTEGTPAQPIIALQQTIGNAATQRALNSDDADPNDQKNRIIALQPVIGNSGVRGMLRRSSAAVIQRRLTITSADLSGKTARSGFGKIKDTSFSSTFRAIEDALDDYHKMGVDENGAQEKILNSILSKCADWLRDKDHQGAADDQKRTGLNKLLTQARLEIRRLQITRELGVPRQTVESFDDNTVEEFWKVVLAFEYGDTKTALSLFAPIKSKLGDGASLIEAFMKRNQVAKIDPALGASMNSSKFEMKSSAGSQQAMQLVKDQAQQKLNRLTQLKADYVRIEAFYQADKSDAINKKQKPVSYDDLPPDKKALYTKIEDKGYPPDALKILRYPLLQAGTPEALEYSKLGIEAQHYEAIISGKAVSDKKKEKGFKDFTETELYGVMGYTSNLYGAINSPLRFDVGDKSKFSAGHTALAGSITSALHKMKPYKGEVYRHGGDFKGYSSVNVPGAVVSDMAPLSTAVDQKGPASAAEDHDVLEILTSVSGRDVSKMSMFGGKEGEILFAPGTRFRVVAAFVRDQAQWGKDHADAQWSINNQIHDPYFAQALAAIKRDDRKKDFHRVVIKVEVP
jgi:hypothetical protein